MPIFRGSDLPTFESASVFLARQLRIETLPSITRSFYRMLWARTKLPMNSQDMWITLWANCGGYVK